MTENEYTPLACLRETAGDELLLDVLVQPKASRNGLCGLHDGRLKVALTSPPVDGKANKALCQWLAKVFGVSRSKLELQAGHTSRRKTVKVTGVDRDEAREILQARLHEQTR